MVKVVSLITQSEFDSLIALADRERRDVRQQASMLIAEGLARRGYRVDASTVDTSNAPAFDGAHP